MTVPSVFGLPHLSEDAVAAFADGVLSDAAAVRARKHCSECSECAQAVRVQRETAMLLRTASAPAAPAGLLDRLAGLPMSTSLPPPRSGLPTMLGADGVPVFVAHNPRRSTGQTELHAHAAATGQQHPHRRVLLPVGILASAAAVVAAGAIGSNVQSLQSPVEHQPASVQLSNDLTSGDPTPSAGPPSSAAPAANFVPARQLVPTRLRQATP
jgi:hypothetical protein